ncbi:MAG: PKD domain-containing protein, partial [Acidimicrobiales bacterium]
MIKQSTTSGDPYAMVAVTPGNGEVFQSQFDNSTSAGSYTFPNAWLELTRVGNVFTAYASANGTAWTEVGSVTITMATDATVGLFVCSHNWDTLGTATFANVTV